MCKKKFAAIFVMAILPVLFIVNLAIAESKKIQDNSFLIEEAYNQEYGVIQHIQTFQLNSDHSFAYSFTQEWPVPGQTNQLSFTIPAARTAKPHSTGLGDVALNYRYQMILKEAIALAPRFSLILPTGDYKKGLGSNSVGLQWNIPLSVELSDKWVTHWNMGATFTPREREPGGARANTFGYNFGASIIWLALENFNPMIETVWISDEAVQPDRSTVRGNTFLINPGFRVAINCKSDLQIVPGISAPIGVGPSKGSYGVFFYLSFEHPLFHRHEQ